MGESLSVGAVRHARRNSFGANVAEYIADIDIAASCLGFSGWPSESDTGSRASPHARKVYSTDLGHQSFSYPSG